MAFEAITYERARGVGVLTLNRPEKLNTLNSVMRREIREVFLGAGDDPEVRCLLITGSGDQAFCAGADQTERTGKGGAIPPEEIQRRHLDPQDMTAAHLRGLPKPVVCAVNGVAAGGGLGMAIAADVTLASDRARFRVAHAPLAMAMVDGLGWLLPRRVGAQRAFELYATNRIVDATEAERIGLVARVVPHAYLMAEARALAEALAAGPPLGLRMTKRALERSDGATLGDYLEFERLAYQVCYFSEDAREARRAFLEKRPPRFQGR